jgi:sporulation protein YlmC with PRC-barrel domain
MLNPVLATAAAVTFTVATASAQEALRQSQKPAEMPGSWVVGATVASPDGEMIGSIDDVLIDAEDGSVTAVIISVGGFLGFGAKTIAVDWEELDIVYDGYEVTLDLAPQEAEDAEEFAMRDREYPPAPPLEPPAGDLGMGGGIQ